MTSIARTQWRFVKVAERQSRARIAAAIGAGVAGLLLCSLVFMAAGASPVDAVTALLKGAFGTWRAFNETLVKATPLIFTGLATAIAFRARLWNIGAEGQVIAGAMLAYWCQSNIGTAPALVQLPALIAAGALGGALYAMLAGGLKTVFSIDEVISTVMLNYVIVFALSMLLLKGPWSEAGGYFEQTAIVEEASKLPLLFDGARLHLGFPLALFAALLVHLVIERTPLGFDIRAAGANLRALEVQGTNVTRLVIVVMALSGLLAGLAGVSEIYGVQYRLKSGVLANLGYTGIIIAILGGLRPLGVVIAAILFGALVNGSTLMQIKTGVPSALIYAIEAIMLLLYLAASALSRYRLTKVAHVE